MPAAAVAGSLYQDQARTLRLKVELIRMEVERRRRDVLSTEDAATAIRGCLKAVRLGLAELPDHTAAISRGLGQPHTMAQRNAVRDVTHAVRRAAVRHLQGNIKPQIAPEGDP